MQIKHFEELDVWKNSRLLVKKIYMLTSEAKLKSDYGLKDQLQRAAVSIMNNIAEGFERDSNKEFVRYLVISKGSAGEVRSLLYVLLDLEHIDNNKFGELSGMVTSIARQLASFIKYLKENNL